jgi:phosphoglycolate phosphatase
MPQYKHIIWDWNGTLLDDTWLSVEIINQLLKKYSMPQVTLETYREIFDFPVKSYYSRLGFDFMHTSFEMVGSEFIQCYLKRWRECHLHENAADILADFSRQGLRQSILSAASRQLIQEGVEHFHIKKYFNELIGLDNYYASGKKEIAGHFIQKNAINPRHLILIGDTTHDFEVAKEIGADCVLLTGGHHSVTKLAHCMVPLMNSLQEINNFLKHDGKD